MRCPEAFAYRRDGKLRALRAAGIGSPKIDIPVPAFIVEHPTAGPLLIDTGMHASVAVQPTANLGPIIGTWAKRNVVMDQSDALPDQLRKRGIDPNSVPLVVMTHLHQDHASGVQQFPGATFLVSDNEWEAASNGGLTDGYMKNHFDHAFDWRLVDFNAEAVSSFATFGRSLDVFGDGSVRLVSTPGHSRGHMSVILRVGDREIMVASDAAFTRRALTDSVLPYVLVDEHQYRRSLKEIQLFARETLQALVIPGHDMEAWNELEPVYG
jgi:glyoxylase-like metal-dependent hydrolase (beta-lactamase superfamily II)